MNSDLSYSIYMLGKRDVTVSLKMTLLAWRLLYNRIFAMDNLIRRRVLQPNVRLCVASCGKSEDIVHLFLACNFFEKNLVWYF